MRHKHLHPFQPLIKGSPLKNQGVNISYAGSQYSAARQVQPSSHTQFVGPNQISPIRPFKGDQTKESPTLREVKVYKPIAEEQNMSIVSMPMEPPSVILGQNTQGKIVEDHDDHEANEEPPAQGLHNTTEQQVRSLLHHMQKQWDV